MQHKNMQQDKFKNIVLKYEPIRRPSPDLQTSTVIQPTFSPTHAQHHRPNTPNNTQKYLTHNMHNVNLEVNVQQQKNSLNNDSHGFFHTSQIRAKNIMESGVREGERIMSVSGVSSQEYGRLLYELDEKRQIISELKNIIKISYQNSAKGKVKTIYIGGEKTPEKEKEERTRLEELKELRDQVKILTIENNKLLDIIEKVRNQAKDKQSNNLFTEHSERQRQVEVLAELGERKESEILHLRRELAECKLMLEQKESFYEKKIDQFIVSHKSLANQCKKIEQQRDQIEAQNKKIVRILKDYEQTQRRGTNREDQRQIKTTHSNQKLSITKIKEQYAESLRQFKETLTIQTEHLFDIFKTSLTECSQKVTTMQKRLAKLQSQLHVKSQLQPKFKKIDERKSQIYIEEGTQSWASDSDSKRVKPFNSTYKQKPFVVSRVYEESLNTPRMQGEQQLVRSLQTQITHLKQIISDLENELSEKSEYYTFRERDYEHSNAELSSQKHRIERSNQELIVIKRQKESKQKQLIGEISKLKQEIDQLQYVYKQERERNKEDWLRQKRERDVRIQQLQHQVDNYRMKYEDSLDQMKNLVSAGREEEELREQLEHAKMKLKQSDHKIEQYKKLCMILKEQTQENVIQNDIFDGMKKQVQLIREKYQDDLKRMGTFQKENKQILIANRQLKTKLEDTLVGYEKVYLENQQFKDKIKMLNQEREELQYKVTYCSNIICILEHDIQTRKDLQLSLVEEKKTLERQLINYLSIFNKLTFQEVKTTHRAIQEGQQLGLQELLHKISKLQASFMEQNTSRREKRQKISKMLSEELSYIDVSQLRRKTQSE